MHVCRYMQLAGLALQRVLHNSKRGTGKPASCYFTDLKPISSVSKACLPVTQVHHQIN